MPLAAASCLLAAANSCGSGQPTATRGLVIKTPSATRPRAALARKWQRPSILAAPARCASAEQRRSRARTARARWTAVPAVNEVAVNSANRLARPANIALRVAAKRRPNKRRASPTLNTVQRRIPKRKQRRPEVLQRPLREALAAPGAFDWLRIG